MRIPLSKYNYKTFISTCNEIIKKSSKNLQIITLLFKPDDSIPIHKIFEENGFNINTTDFGEIIEVSTKYNLYKTEREVHFYILRHPKYEPIYFVVSFNGVGDIYRTLPRLIDPVTNLYYLWLPPTYFDALRERILKVDGAYMTYFHGKKLDATNQECKRPRFYRDIKYKGDDAKTTLDEIRFEYGVLPQTIEFVIPSISKFKINKNGFYTLFNGDLAEFIENIIESFIKMVIKDNEEIERAKYSIKKKGEIQILNSQTVKFELEQGVGFEEFEDFIGIMKKSDFSSYNIRLREGSVIFSANIVDEKKGNIFSVTSNGKQFTIIPKYNSSFVSIIRFHRFLIEKIDQLTRVIHTN